MKTLRRLCVIVGALAIAAVAVALALAGAGGSQTLAAPVEDLAPRPLARPSARSLAALPAETCTLAGTTRTCEVWAMAGTITVPGDVSVPIWGFADTAAGPAQLPGPALIVNEGETVEVVFHNTLPQTVSLSFPGQLMMPDFVGIGAGETTTYTFEAAEPGTFLYEAGLTPDGARQVAMGLFGGLVVRPATANQAYADPVSAYTAESLLIFSELDPEFNNNPQGFLMEQFRPQYWLINGKAYSETENIVAAAGDRLLLRMINAGVQDRSIGALGLRQGIVGMNGVGVDATRVVTVVADTLAPGSTLDTVTVIPTGAVSGTQYALYNTALENHNNNRRLASGRLEFGGMLTFVEITTGTLASDTGPVVTSATAEPDTTTGESGVTLTFVFSATNGGNVVAAEYFVNDVPVAPGTGTPLSFAAGPVVTVNQIVPATELAGWAAGYYQFYARAQDDSGVWGAVNAATLNLDKQGPESIGLTLVPNPTNGTRAMMLRGTADDHTHGNNPVVAATYALDGGASVSMALNLADSPIVEVSALVAAADVLALGEGQHPVTVVSEDALGNLGAAGTITLSVDLTGPDTGPVATSPASLDLTSAPSVSTIRLDAQIADPSVAGVQSNLATAEGFVDALGAPGTGFPLFPSDGLFDEPTEDVYYPMPVTHFALLSQGDHDIWVRGRDAAGNWGPATSGTVTVIRGATDAEGPAITAIAVAPNPTDGATVVTLTANAADVGLLSNVAGAEWFVGQDPGIGNGYPMAAVDGAFDETSELMSADVDVSTWNNGNRTISVRAYDTAFNWGAVQTVVLQVTNNNALQVFADAFDAGTLDAWSAVVGNVTVTPVAAQMGAQAATAPAGMQMQANVSGIDPAYVVLDLPAGESSVDVSFWFDPNSTIMGTGAHDIFVGLDYAGLRIFGIEAEQPTGSGASGYEIRAWVLDNGVVTYTPQVDIDDQPVELKLHWTAGPAAGFALTVDGVEVVPAAAPDTSMYTLRQVRLGPSDSLNETMAGSELFDEFTLTRSALVPSFSIFLPLVVR